MEGRQENDVSSSEYRDAITARPLKNIDPGPSQSIVESFVDSWSCSYR